MKKLYSTPNVIKAVSLGTAMAALLSSVSPVFSANLAITGASNLSTNLANVAYSRGSHGSIVFAGDDDYCGVDNVRERGGSSKTGAEITAEEQYNRFINGYSTNNGGNPYGTTAKQVTWLGDGVLSNNSSYMGTATGGIRNATPEAFGIYSFATGCGSSATGNYSTAFGAGATTKAGGAQAFGVSALASGIASVAMGVGSEASGESTIAIGGLADALGKNSVAVGLKAKAKENFAIAIGAEAEAQASGAIAIGSRRSDRTETSSPNRKVIAKGENAIAIGSHTYAEAEDSVAIGVNAQAHVYDGVAVGGGSVSDRAKGEVGYDPYLNGDSTETGIAWKSTAGAFSVGEVGGKDNGQLTRQITGVAAGSKDTDAVNVAQLRAMKDLVTGEWKVSVNDQDATTVKGRDTVDFSVKNNQEVGQDNLKIEKSTENNKNKIQFALNDQLKLTSVTTGQSSMSDDGFMFTNGGPRMTIDGIDAGNEKITGVKAGEGDTDAVNFKQLKEFTAGIKGGGWKLSVDGNDSTDVEAGSTVYLLADERTDGHENITIEKTDNNEVWFNLNDELRVERVITDSGATIDDDGFTFWHGGPSMTKNGIDADNKKITKVKAGEEDTDAVNFKQLKEFTAGIKGGGWKLSVDGNNTTDVEAGTTVDLVAGENTDGNKNITIEKDGSNKVTFTLNDELNLTSVTTGDSIMSDGGFMFANGEGPSMTTYGIDAGKENITNVKAGENDTDAVNFKQLKDVKQLATKGWKLSVDGNNATDVGAGTTVDLIAGETNDHKNITIAKDGSNKVTFALNDELNLTSVTTGDSIMSKDGFAFTSWGPSMTINGIDAGYEKIKNVKAGENDTDAVNFKQLKEVEQLATKGWKLSVDGNNATDVGAGTTVDLIAGETNGHKNIKIAKDGTNKVTFTLNDELNLTSITTGNSTMSDKGFMFVNGGPRMTIDGIDAGNKKITGVLNGTGDTDAVNVSQLNEIKDQIADNSLVKWHEEGKLITIGAEKDGIEINIANNEDKQRIISGVAVGKVAVNSTEAVNGHQLFSYIDNIVDFFGGDKTDILNGINPTFTVQDNEYDNVTDAFEAVDNSIVEISNQINNITSNSLVQQEGENGIITIGKARGGDTIDIVNKSGQNRKISGVKDGSLSNQSSDAINGSQINTISGDIAKFFGGNAAFENGTFVGPKYNLSTVSTNGQVEQKEYTDVGKALEGLDVNIKNVNKHIEYVDNKFDRFSQDALLWDEAEQAFVARHGADGNKEKSKIKFLEGGDINSDSLEAINGSQLHSMGSQIANYFGGGASYEEGEWTQPTFKISKRNANGNIVQEQYHNVADAFAGVDDFVTNIYNQINDVTENSLVKQDGENSPITIGKATGGDKIIISNKSGQERTISGVKDGMISQTSTEAINGSQLFTTNKNITDVTNKLEQVTKNTSKYFGGGADVLEDIEPSFLIQNKAYHNVAEAFTGVNTSITNIDNKISEMKENNLVQQDDTSKIITIGAKTAGTEINIAGYGKVPRKISGVQAAEKGDEAVNKDQLDKSIEKISKDIETASAAAVLYDKENGVVNYGRVTLGGAENNGPVALLNVKDGKIAENSHDAINGGQINKISKDIANYFGGGTEFVNGAFKGPKYTLSIITEDGTIGNANYRDVGSALTGLDANVKSVNSRLTNVANSFTQKIEGLSKDALLWDDEEEAFVALHEKNGEKTKSKLKFLLDGEIAQGSTDAITGNQLYLISNQLASYFGGGAKYENGQWTAPNFKISETNENGETVEKNYNNVADAFGGVNNNMSKINDRIDEVVNKVDSDALKWNKEKGAYDAGRNGKPSKIVDVADGKVEKGSKDAVNGGQLWETNERITGVEKDVKHISNRVDNISNTIADIGDIVTNIDTKVDNIDTKVNNIAEDAVRYDRDANGKKTNKITLKGGDDSEPVLIDNVADGKIEKGSKEAVNGGQLHDYTKEQMKIVLDESKHYTDQRVNNIVIDAIDDAVEKAKQYTDMKFDALRYGIEDARKEAKQAAAIGLAVSNLRYNDMPGKLSVAFGSGLWRSQSAFAFGAGYTSEKGDIRSNLSVTTSGGHWGIGAGFNMTLN